MENFKHEGDQTKLNIFGKEIIIHPTGQITRMTKHSDDVVNVSCENQGKQIYTYPINTIRDYGKSADEFITEFESINWNATNDVYQTVKSIKK